jgi:dynein heavy chain
MTSAEPETMPETVRFSASVMAEGPVENWLMRIQEMMVKSLYDSAKQALLEYPNDDPLNREKWLFGYNAQNILLIDLVKWTEGVTEAVLNEEKNPKQGVAAYEAFMREMITKMVAIVRKDLTILQRTLMGALIVLDVHARDVVTELLEKGVKNLNDFEFSKQLRYYW